MKREGRRDGKRRNGDGGGGRRQRHAVEERLQPDAGQ